MSRGLGKVQTGILEALETHGDCNYNQLSEHIYGVGHYWNTKEFASISRAVTSLVNKGYVKRRGMTDSEEEHYRPNPLRGFQPVVIQLVKR
jgi:hypothetical protein